MKSFNTQIIFMAIAIQQAFSLDITNFPNHRAMGIEKVQQGAIAHCGSDPGQQCFKVDPSVDNISVTNPSNVTISCQPDNLCVFGFEPTQQQPTINITINCLDTSGFEEGSYIPVFFGNLGQNDQHKDVYGVFNITGGHAFATWGSIFNNGYYNQSSGPIETNQRADTLYTKCESVSPF